MGAAPRQLTQTPEKPIPLKLLLIREADQRNPAETIDSHEASISNGLRQRLKGICSNLAPEEFDALVRRMTREQLRGESRSHR